MDTLIQALTPLLMALIGWVSWKAKAFLEEKIKSEKVKRIASRLTDVAADAAKHVAQVYVDDIRKSSKDGVLSDEEKKTARELALKTLLQDMGKTAEDELFQFMQFASEKERDEFLSRKIESAVATLKQISPAKAEVANGSTPEK